MTAGLSNPLRDMMGAALETSDVGGEHNGWRETAPGGEGLRGRGKVRKDWRSRKTDDVLDLTRSA